MFAKSFSKSLDKLHPAVQEQAKARITEFLMNPELGGHNLEPVQGARDRHLYSVRVNRDIRLILYRKDERHAFLYVDRHDKAYDWANRHEMSVHPSTGAAQLIEIEEVTHEVVRTIITQKRIEPPLFEAYDESYLLALGVPERYLPAVQHVGASRLVDLIDHLPEEAMERLLLLAEGSPVPVPAVAAGIDPFEHPDAQRRFRAVASEAELQSALDHPWEQWLVFLHPTQRELVERQQSGPARVSGAAGTGKTVVALHRVAHLHRANPRARILLTTYSKALASRLAKKLGLLIGSDNLEAQVKVSNLHATAVWLWNKWDHAFRRVNDDQLANIFESALANAPKRSFAASFVRAEWDQVVDALGIRTWQEYQRVPRIGRGTPLGIRQRKQLWDIFETVHEELEVQTMLTFDGLCHRVAEGLERLDDPPFDHVVIDESQDLGPAELRLVRALAPSGVNDLFFAGDMGQRIYRGRYSWLSNGVDVRGRSACLRINYRTTQQIRAFADELLPMELVEADGDSETRMSVSLLSGVEPRLLEHQKRDEEIATIASTLEDLLENGYQPADIAIFARTKWILQERALPALERLELESQQLKNDSLPAPDAVSLGSMHIAKGLEFKAVLIVGCDEDQVPFRLAVSKTQDDAERAGALEIEQQLLYVACTRAREALIVTSTGPASKFLRRSRAG